MKIGNNKVLLLLAVTILVSAIAGLIYSTAKQYYAKKEAIKKVYDMASCKDGYAEELLEKALKRHDVSILRPLRRRYHIETMYCAVDDTIKVSNVAENQNALTYFKSRLNDRPLNSSHLIYNMSENATKHYVAMQETKDSVLFIEIESRKPSYPSMLTQIIIADRAKETFYNESSDISFARYETSMLVFQSGNFPYAKQNSFITGRWSTTMHHYFHYQIQGLNPDELWVVTIHSNLWMDMLIAASMMFLLTIALASFAFVVWKLCRRESFSLRASIFLLIMGLFLFVFVILALISVRNVKNMNTEAYIDVLKEKTLSINIEISTFLAQNDTAYSLSEFVLRLSNAFFVDINIFDSTGVLVISSKERVFEDGSLSKAMNPDAFCQLSGTDSNFVSPILVQSESFHNLKFLSSYMPIVNEEGVVSAYLNIPFISQQRELDIRIKSVITNFAGIYLLVMSIVVLIAALVSNILTNIKKNERDKAWKELAKQVAHEVKNPLTPMKLSIQYLVRLKESGEMKFDERFAAISSSLIEQIDTLSEIATGFSDYSRIQDAELQPVNVVLCLQAAISMFESIDNLSLNSDMHHNIEVTVLADKALLIRTFNNLIKNAIQALSNSHNGRIDIDLQVVKYQCKLTIADNGCGISPENQTKIFVDSFTTKNDGSGLGLVIVKNTIESFKGSLSFSSKEGTGTKFVVTLPLIAE